MPSPHIGGSRALAGDATQCHSAILLTGKLCSLSKDWEMPLLQVLPGCKQIHDTLHQGVPTQKTAGTH